MSMQEPTDNQLDGLFRKSAEEFVVPYDPAAWQALKNRLDAHDRLTVWEHVLRWGLPVLLLAILTAGSWNANRKQARASQTLRSGVAAGQSAGENKVSQLNSAAQKRQPRIDNSPFHPNETLRADLPKPDGPTKGAIAQPGANEPPVGVTHADERVANADESVVPSTTNKGGFPTTAGVTDHSSNSSKQTTLAKRAYPPDSPVRPSTVMAPVPAVSASRTKSNKRAITMEQTKRVRSGTTHQRGLGKMARNENKNRSTTSLSAKDHLVAPERLFTKHRETPSATGESWVKKSGNGNRQLPDALVRAYTVTTTTTPVSAQATTDKGNQSAQPASFVELTNRPGQWPKPLSFIGRDVSAPATPIALEMAAAKQSLSTQPAYIQKGMSIRFVASPDLSGIRLNNLSRPGQNIGLLLEYRMASRWSVQAGVLRSTKVYRASTTAYELPDYTKRWKVQPQRVNGRCSMLDIPLNLRYDVALRPRSKGRLPSRWFVSGGVTTYIMQKEDYDYVYAEADKKHVYPNAYPSMTGWHGKTGAVGFSQLNLSMGYELALGRRLSWQVEPFVKVPMKGVGYFKVDLLSTGAFFSLRYKL